MQMPKWRDVRRPIGAFLPNWPILVGIVLSGALLVGLFMTTEEPLIDVNDPLDVAIEAPEVSVVPGAAGIRGRTGSIEPLARQRAREQERLRQSDVRAERNRQREQAIAQQDEAARLRRARRQAEALRGMPSQPGIEYEQSDALAMSADETSLIQALDLADRQRRFDALRAPAVVSSARGIGERVHQLDRPEITDFAIAAVAPRSAFTAAPVASAAPSVFPPPVLPPPFPSAPAAPSFTRPAAPGSPAPGFPPLPNLQGGGQPYPPRATPLPSAGGPLGQGPLFTPFTPDPAPVPAGPDVVSGLGAPPSQHAGAAPPADAPMGTRLSYGPRADGGVEDTPVGVVVTADDGPYHRLYEGTLIPAALQTQLNGQYSGPLSAQVTRSVWSPDRSVVLIPRGTVALGTAGSVTGVFQDRLAVTFHRLIFPDGRWLELGFAGLNGRGETSLKDQVDRHYVQLFGTAGAVGLLAGFTQQGDQGSQGFRSSMSDQMANTSLQILSQFLNRRPDITIRAGHRVNVWLTSDVLVPAELR